MASDRYSSFIVPIKKPENIITGFTLTPDRSPQALISGQSYTIFNSNDYLGLRFNPDLITAEHSGCQKFGVGPGAVRFISGTLQVHKELELAIARFHHKEDALTFSSAFMANVTAITALVSDRVLVLSDQLNHRSIIDGIRLANLPATNRLVYRHLDYSHLNQLLSENVGKFDRAIVISDGVFSMLGEIVDLLKLRQICDQFDKKFPQGVLLYLDDAHGIGVIGDTGRGTEEFHRQQADILSGTLGKAFGCDGGYITSNKTLITYLRETASGYIYSNNLSPGAASAALASLQLVASPKGQNLLTKLHANMQLLGTQHAIKPVVFGDPDKTTAFKRQLFEKGILVTAINYPVVPQGQDEIRIQLSASHTSAEIENLISLLHAQNL